VVELLALKAPTIMHHQKVLPFTVQEVKAEGEVQVTVQEGLNWINYWTL
jgi:hypothetical protein